MLTVYKIQFDNNHSYIGITSNFDKRKIRHEWEARTERSYLPVHRAMRKYNYEFKELCYCSTKEEASEIEQMLISQLSNLYNLDSGGYGIHKEFKYTEEEIRQDALRYDSKQAWRENSKIASTVRKHKPELYKEVTKHMKRPKPHNFKWTKDKLIKHALSFNTYSDWYFNGRKSYDVARKRGYLQEIKQLFNKE